MKPTCRPAERFRMVGLTLLKALPLTAVLFLLFPRISGPLWGTPGDANAGNTGLSNSMSPGSISQLLESTEIAFRARFDGATPSNDKLYWRGPVFGTFNGRSWCRCSSARARRRRSRFKVSHARSFRTRSRWRQITATGYSRSKRLPGCRRCNDFRRASRRTCRSSLATWYVSVCATRCARYTRYRFNAEATEVERRNWLDLPPTYNPRTLQLAEEIRGRAGSNADTCRAKRSSTCDAEAISTRCRRRGWGEIRSTNFCSTHARATANTMRRHS